MNENKENEKAGESDAGRRSAKILFALFLVMSSLVATHEGEFWPFSIYPMFSRATTSWSRAIVRDITDVPDALTWNISSISELPGRPFALRDHDIEGPDIANFVVKNRDWSQDGQRGFRKIFEEHLAGRRLMLFRLDGVAADDTVSVQATPVLLMMSDTTEINPYLDFD